MNKSPPEHIAETIKFHHVCSIAERIRNAEQIKVKEKILERYYESFLKHRLNYRDQKGISSLDEEDGSSSFYCVLRCLMPQEDRARKSYDLQPKRLGNVFIKVLQIPEDSLDAQKLKARSYFGKFEDYAALVCEVIKVRCRNEVSTLTLKEVHEMLDKIASEDVRSTEFVLTKLLEKASCYEVKWFIRLLLKTMGLGMGEQRIFNILHKQAKDLYQRCSNLEKVCCLISNKNLPEPAVLQNQSLNLSLNLNLDSVIEPFQHIRPMLCERFPGNIEELMATDVLYMERKMDGERFQLHFANGRFKYISRNGVDYTHSFGSSFEEGNFSCLLKSIWPTFIESVIFDGEMMIWDEVGKRFREKGENTDVKNLNHYPNWRPCFVIYDLLYLNGRSLLDLNYAQRNFKLQDLINEEKTILEKMQPEKVSSVEDFISMFQAAINSKAEGVVIKKQSSKYLPGVRFGGGWYKDKADYIKGLTEEFDLLVMGGFYNTQKTYIESFLMGVLKQKSADHFELYSVGRVNNTLWQRANLNNLLKPHWNPLDRELPPSWYHFVAKNAEGRPDVWIEPQKSCILQIKATDLAPSGAFSLKKALHFPRIVAWRNDKVWNECMTVEEYNGLCQGQQGLKKLNKRNTTKEDFMANRKRQKETPAQKRKRGIESYEKRLKVDEIERVSDILEGFYVCVLTGSLDLNKTREELRVLAVKNGAEIVENPLPNEPKCINIAGDDSYRLTVLKKSKKYDIVSVEWFLEVCRKQVLKLRSKDMVCMTQTLEEQFASNPEAGEEITLDMEEDDNEEEEENNDPGEKGDQEINQHESEEEEENSFEYPQKTQTESTTGLDKMEMETERMSDEELLTHLGNATSRFYNLEDVQKLLDSIQDGELELQIQSFDPKLKEELELQLYGDNSKKCFNNCCGLFVTDDAYTSMAKCYFLFNGGSCFTSLSKIINSLLENPKCSNNFYIFSNNKNCDNNQLDVLLKAKKHILSKLKPKVLNLEWIIDSSESSNKLNHLAYSIMEI